MSSVVKKYGRVLLVAAAVCGLFERSARASAWTWEPWHFYMQLGTSYSSASNERIKYFDISANRNITIDRRIIVAKYAGDATKFNSSNFQQLLSDFYFELGTLRWLTLFGDIPFLSSNRQDNKLGTLSYHSANVGDIMVGLRASAMTKPIALAVEARFTFPSGVTNSPQSASKDVIIPTGQGDYRQELRAVASKGFDKVPIYIDAELGFTLRGHVLLQNQITGFGKNNGIDTHYKPEFVVHGEIGGTVVRWRGVDRLVLALNVEHRQSTEIDAKSVFSTIIAESSRQTWIGVNGIVYFTRNFGVNLSFRRALEVINLPYLTSVGGALFGTY